MFLDNNNYPRSYSYLLYRPMAFDDSPSAKGAAFYILNKVRGRAMVAYNEYLNIVST